MSAALVVLATAAAALAIGYQIGRRRPTSVLMGQPFSLGLNRWSYTRKVAITDIEIDHDNCVSFTGRDIARLTLERGTR